MNYSVLPNLTRVVILLFLLLPAAAHAQYRDSDVGQMERAGAGKPAQSELSFVRNLGQWPRQVRYAARLKGVDLWITDSSVLYDLHTITSSGRATDAPALDQAQERGNEHWIRRGHLVNMRFAGASASSIVEGARKMEGYHNYFIGDDPARWATNVPLFHETRIRNLYPGISLLLHFDNGYPRYDFLLEPNANPDLIRLQFDGADRLSITPSGELAIGTSLGTVRQQRLFAYQMVNGRKRSIPCSFRMLEDGTVGFELGRYDARLPLVIDPILYSTFLGGSGNDNALGLATDLSGNTCLTGFTGSPSPFASVFPTTLGGYSYEQHGNSDVFVTKVTLANKVVFSTIIGGRGFDDGRDIGLDRAGNIYVTGFTSSANFPTTAGAFSPAFTGGSHDAFVLKLPPDGSSLAYSTFVGGSHSDAAYSITVDEIAGTVRVAGNTYSADFPTSATAYDRTHNGESDIFCFTLSASGASLVSSTFIGGSGVDYASGTTFDAANRNCIIGTTRSTDFPTTANAPGRENRGGLDAVVIKLNVTNTTLDYSTYLGGSRDDYGQDMVMDPGGNTIVCGYTESGNFPVAGNAFQPSFQGGTYDGFVCSILFNGSRIIYSSFIGGRGEDYALALAQYGRRTWIGGSTRSDNFRYTLAVPDSSYNGAEDGFAMLLDMITDSLHYSTFVGGSARDVVQDIGYETFSRRLHVCGTTISENYPATPDAYQRRLARKFEGENEPATPSYDAFFMRVETTVIILLTETPGDQLLLCPNSDYMIRWASFDVTTIQISLRDESGRVFHSELLNNSPAMMVKWPWLLPANQPAGTRFRIYIQQFLSPQYSDLGSMDFTIIDGPQLVRGITSRDVCPGEKVNFSLEANGYNISYIWRRNGFTVFGATTPSFTIDSVTTRDTGTYEAVVYDACGNIALTQKVELTMKPTPEIMEEPVDEEACAGQTASLRIAAEGDDLRYQWYKDGAPVPGGTSAVLNIDNVSAQDEGYYTCHVMGGLCPNSPIPSARARLKVVYERIVEQPRNQSVQLGDPVSFAVLAFGQDPTYQWRKDGQAIPGATISTYSIDKAKLSDAGYYDVVVNGKCEILSSSALLTVTTFSGVTGERDESASHLIMVQPNPVRTRGVIRIMGAAGGLHGKELALYDVLGRRVMDLTANLRGTTDEAIEFDTDALTAGIYYCRLTGKGWSHTSPMIVVEK